MYLEKPKLNALIHLSSIIKEGSMSWVWPLVDRFVPVENEAQWKLAWSWTREIKTLMMMWIPSKIDQAQS